MSLPSSTGGLAGAYSLASDAGSAVGVAGAVSGGSGTGLVGAAAGALSGGVSTMSKVLGSAATDAG
ncbi:hypothetical protein, partial [Mycobacterium sp.]|uniref:hypothetical protein n=1 Tax=Mycobacterium sp. TaxID=1785 RepID=UPI003F9A4BB8